MGRLIEIADTDERGAFLGMPDVLAPLSPEAYALRWRILDLGEVVARERWDLNLPVIEKAVRESPTGFELSFEELVQFAERVVQVIDGLFVGYDRPPRNPRRDQDDATILENSDMVVSAFDSSVWLVSAPDDVLRRFRERFEKVSEADPNTPLSAWDPLT